MDIKVQDIVEALIIKGGDIRYGVEYLLARTIGMLSEEKKNTIWNQLGREGDLTSNYEFEYGTAEVYTSGVYFKFNGASHRTSASYFVDLNGNIGRKQRGELLDTIDFYADGGYVNWGGLEGRLDNSNFNGIEDSINLILEGDLIINKLDKSTVIADMPLYNLMIADYNLGVLELGSKSLVTYDENIHTAIDKKLYKEVEFMIKNRGLNSFIDRYAEDYDMGLFEIEPKRGFYRIIIPTGSMGQRIAIDVYSFKISDGKILPLNHHRGYYAKINMDYVKIDTTSAYTDFTINGVKSISGSQLINYLDTLGVSYRFYLMDDLIQVELDDDYIYDDNGIEYNEFAMESEITNYDKLIEGIRW